MYPLIDNLRYVMLNKVGCVVKDLVFGVGAELDTFVNAFNLQSYVVFTP